MRYDNLLSFVTPGTPLSVVGANTTFNSTALDLSSFGSGVANTNIIGTPTSFGTDLGIGRMRAEILAVIGTAFATATSATLNAALQFAPDNGSNAAGTYVTTMETGAMTAAQLTAGTGICRWSFPPVFPQNMRPRFVRIQFTVVNTSTAGTIAYAILTPARDDLGFLQAARNYAVA